MQDDIKPLIAQARQCHPTEFGHWLLWVGRQFEHPCDPATLAELEALQADLERRKKDAEPKPFFGASAADLW